VNHNARARVFYVIFEDARVVNKSWSKANAHCVVVVVVVRWFRLSMTMMKIFHMRISSSLTIVPFVMSISIPMMIYESMFGWLSVCVCDEWVSILCACVVCVCVCVWVEVCDEWVSVCAWLMSAWTWVTTLSKCKAVSCAQQRVCASVCVWWVWVIEDN